MNNNTVELWDETYRGRTRWRGWPYRLALEAVPADFTPDSVLDVGCGLGDGLLICRERWPKARLCGLDFSPVGLEKASRRVAEPKEPFPVTDLNNERHRNCLVLLHYHSDLVLCCETLEHVDDPVAVEILLKAMTRKMLVITVPLEGRRTAHHPNSFSLAWFQGRGYSVQTRPHPVPKDGLIIVASYSPCSPCLCGETNG